MRILVHRLYFSYMKYVLSHNECIEMITVLNIYFTQITRTVRQTFKTLTFNIYSDTSHLKMTYGAKLFTRYGLLLTLVSNYLTVYQIYIGICFSVASKSLCRSSKLTSIFYSYTNLYCTDETTGKTYFFNKCFFLQKSCILRQALK